MESLKEKRKALRDELDKHDSSEKAVEALASEIKALEAKMEDVAQGSAIAKTLSTIPGFGAICTAELAGEIGTIQRSGSGASLALYVGRATPDNSSGRQKGSKAPRQVNTACEGRHDDCR